MRWFKQNTDTSLGIILLFIVYTNGDLRCLSCVDVIQPRHCHYIRHCKDGEVCVTEKFQTPENQILFNVGCKSKSYEVTLTTGLRISGGILPMDNIKIPAQVTKITSHGDFNTEMLYLVKDKHKACDESNRLHQQTREGNRLTKTLCSECCDGDLCNSDGCGEPGFPLNTGPICYNCPQSQSLNTCDTISVCKPDEFCGKITKFPGIIGKRNKLAERDTRCSRCCNETLCNTFCDTPGSNVLTTSSMFPTTITTSATTTVTTEPTTTQAKRQCVDSKGTEFILTFLQDFDGQQKIQLLLTSHDDPSSIEIVSKVSGISRNLTFRGNGTIINLDKDVVQTKFDTTVNSKGVYIKSSKPISVHAMSIYSPSCCTSGGFTALPFRMLGNRYIVASYPPSPGYHSNIGLAAGYDNSHVTVTFNTTSTGTVRFNGTTYFNGDSARITLNKLDTALFQSSSDLTGTSIKSNKIITVVSGVDAVELDGSDYEFMTDTMPPVDRWGRFFVVQRIYPAKRKIIRVVPSDIDVIIYIYTNGNTTVRTYRTSSTIEINLRSANIYFVNCSKPCLVVQYCNDPIFNPFMVVVPSIKQYSNNYVLQTPNLKSFNNYISVTIETKYANGLLYNGKFISSNVTTSTDNNNVQWSSITMNIKEGTSTIRHVSDNVYFGIIQYGTRGSNDEAYAFPVGFGSSC